MIQEQGVSIEVPILTRHPMGDHLPCMAKSEVTVDLAEIHEKLRRFDTVNHSRV